jgi:uroporphyrinogen decarboxylase
VIIQEHDDIAGQDGPLISPQMLKEFVDPMHKKLFSYIRKKAQNDVHILYHSCGAVKELIPMLIEEGISALNPVQISAKGMDLEELKKEFGQDITFWGGGVDTQEILPNGTPEDVEEATKRSIDVLAPGGGFVFASVHNIQADVPTENFMAMWKTLKEYGVY